MIFGRRVHEPVVVATCATEEQAERIWAVLIDANIPSVIQHDPAMLGGPQLFQVLVENGRSAEAIAALSKGDAAESAQD